MFVFVDDVFFVGCEDVFPFEGVDPEVLLLSDPEALLSPDEVVLGC